MASSRTLLVAIVASALLLSRASANDLLVDLFGDPLPPYATARLGTARLRHGQPVATLAFSPDGKSLLSVGWGDASLSMIRLWDAADGKEKWSVRQRFASCAAFAPDGRSVAVGGGMGLVRSWQAETGRELRMLTGDSGAVSAVVFAPGGNRLFTAGGSGNLHLCDAANGGDIRAFIGHNGAVLGLALSADGKTLASTGADGTLRLWEVANGKELLKIAAPAAMDRVALSSDGKILFAVGKDGPVRRWTTSGAELPSLHGDEKQIKRSAFSPDARFLAASAGDLILIHDLTADKTVARITPPTEDVSALAISLDGKTLAAAGANGTLHVWDVTASKERYTEQGHLEAVTAVAYSPQGRIAATASEDGTVRLWDALGGKPLRMCDGKGLRTSSLAFAADGSTLTAAGAGREAWTWEVATGRKARANTPPMNDKISTVPLGKFTDETVRTIGPERRLIAIGRANGLVYILEAASGKTIRVLSGHSGAVAVLAFSPDGRLLASGGADHLLRIWETATGTELLALAGHRGPVRAAAFSPDGRTLLSGGAEGVGLLWDLTRGPNGSAARRQTLTPSDLAKCWADLLSEDGPTTNGALWTLALAPDQSVPFIHDQMRPLFGGDAQRTAKLIVDLDDDSFDVREQASAGLAAMGPTIAPLLNQALASTQSSEVRHRLQELLSKLKEAIPWERERLRVFRALAALEQSGAPAAREALEATAKGAMESELKQAAREALEHLPAAKPSVP